MSHTQNDGLQLLKWTKRLKRKRLYRLLERLTRMSGPELAQRLRVTLRKVPHFRRQHVASYTQGAMDCADAFVERTGPHARERLTQHLDERFFFGPGARAALADELRATCGASAARILRLADDATTSGIVLLGQTIRLHPDIDWHADPATGKRAWPSEWLDEATAIDVPLVDVKYVWELNRQQYLTLFGVAYWLSGDERHARTAAQLVDGWIAANPPGPGVNWCSHLEVAMRSISWLWTLPFLLSWPGLDESFLRRWLESLAHHYYHLSRNLSTYTDPTNHLIGEATGLFMLATCLPDLPGADEQAARTRELLFRELGAQTHSDGVNREQATSYHRFVLDFYTQVLVLLGSAAPAAARASIEKMFELACAMAGRHGIAPMIGDSDDARALPFLDLVGWDFSDVTATGAALFARPEWQLSSSSRPVATALLLHARGDARERSAPPRERRELELFADGGYCFIRSAGAQDAELVFDIGPLGLWPNASHGHADALAIGVRVGARFLIGDPGTGAYFASAESRNRFRGTAAHNTITVDGLDQADIFGTFKWVNPFTTRVLDSSAHGLAHVSAEHDGYARLRLPVRHRRSVLALPSGGWLVVDYLYGRGAHRYAQRLHFAPEVAVEASAPNVFTALEAASGLGLSLMLGAASDAPPAVLDRAGVWSHHYGSVQQAPRLTWELEAEGPLALVTLVEPFATGIRPARRTVTPQVLGDGAVVCDLAAQALRETVLINPAGGKLVLPDGTATSARAAYLRRDADGKLLAAQITGSGARLVAGTVELEIGQSEASSAYDSAASTRAM